MIKKNAFWQAKLHDCNIISEVASRECVTSFVNGLSDTDLETHLLECKSDCYFINRLNTDMLIVAETGKDLVGYLQVCDINLQTADFKWNPQSQMINVTYTWKEFQTRGIASAVISFALKLERVMSTPCIYVDVWEESKKAINLY